MKEYRVKIGNLYIYDIDTNEDFVNTNFIENIELHSEKPEYGYKVSEDKKEKLRRILKDILELPDSYSISFEEVESQHE